jgi:hypothetical protein
MAFFMKGENMAIYQVSQNGVSLSAATAKSVFELIPAAAGDAEIKSIGVWFKSVTTTDVPVLVEYGVDITGGATLTGTAITAANISRWKAVHASQQAAGAVKVTSGGAEGTWSPASTTADPYVSLYVSPLGGFEVYFPLGEEMYVIPSGIFRVRLTAPQAQTCAFSVRWEE